MKKAEALKFKRRVMRVINDSDIILEVVDARFPQDTRNKELEKIVKNKGKTLMIVINKADLVPLKEVRKIQEELEYPSVYTSCKSYQGISNLKVQLQIMAKGKEMLKVGIIGMPNTGKSSITNRLRHKKVARVSPLAGFTKGEQWIKILPNVMLLDSPGVLDREIPYKLAALVGSRNPEEFKSAEPLAIEI
ncbi:MAG: 50S ribosome-binding GTPase, partial [Candidatus Diapherotrites archaeon]|nr:50S ribosome-binding GTPase [Candidatus Diapherotrites archaeon]